jgi:hypothetical protein
MIHSNEMTMPQIIQHPILSMFHIDLIKGNSHTATATAIHSLLTAMLYTNDKLEIYAFSFPEYLMNNPQAFSFQIAHSLPIFL